MGALDHHKFGNPGQVRSLVRVVAAGVQPHERELFPVSVVVTESSDLAFILHGGLHEVRLAGNLSQDTERSSATMNDPCARLHIAVEARERAGRGSTTFWRGPGVIRWRRWAG